MMYKNSFVVSIHDTKKNVLRENKEKEVFLPFDSEYGIKLKNNNSRKAVAEVTIDGTNVLGSNKLVIDVDSFVDLERFCIDGDVKKGNKFKFVKAGVEDPHPDIQDPTSPENGNIKVRFWLEKEDPIGYFGDDISINIFDGYIFKKHSPFGWIDQNDNSYPGGSITYFDGFPKPYCYSNLPIGCVGISGYFETSGVSGYSGTSGTPRWYSPIHPAANWQIKSITTISRGYGNAGDGSIVLSDIGNSTCYGSSIKNNFQDDSKMNVVIGTVTPMASLHILDSIESQYEDVEEKGATVEGAQSSQIFSYQSIGELEEEFTEICLTIKPFKKPIMVKDTKNKFCSQCGLKNKFYARFCIRCGTKIDETLKGEVK